LLGRKYKKSRRTGGAYKAIRDNYQFSKASIRRYNYAENLLKIAEKYYIQK
jgi:hypothetical protein